ncbi:MAG: flavodoxin family protein, partial [Armatimonadota bacterium]
RWMDIHPGQSESLAAAGVRAGGAEGVPARLPHEQDTEVADMRALIVYYSRTGVTKKVCNAIADVMRTMDGTVEVQVEEIVDTKDRSGVLGYAGGGRDAMLKKSTEIEPVEADVASFDLVVIGTPVWAFTCAPAARAFCEQFADDLDTVAFVATMGGSGDEGAFKSLEEYCGAKPLETLSLRERDVKNVEPANYVAPVEAFAEDLVARVGG